MTNKRKQTKDALDAANKEVRQVMDKNARLQDEVAKLRSDKVMLMWQMDIIRTTLSRVVQP
jgi:septal ring factor EnvC (AmiA/AmiB activator)